MRTLILASVIFTGWCVVSLWAGVLIGSCIRVGQAGDRR
jgi:hypothetical protein